MRENFWTLGAFQRRARKGLQPHVQYNFASRVMADASARWLRAESMWIVEWVGPQSFMVF